MLAIVMISWRQGWREEGEGVDFSSCREKSCFSYHSPSMGSRACAPLERSIQWCPGPPLLSCELAAAAHLIAGSRRDCPPARLPVRPPACLHVLTSSSPMGGGAARLPIPGCAARPQLRDGPSLATVRARGSGGGPSRAAAAGARVPPPPPLHHRGGRWKVHRAAHLRAPSRGVVFLSVFLVRPLAGRPALFPAASLWWAVEGERWRTSTVAAAATTTSAIPPPLPQCSRTRIPSPSLCIPSHQHRGGGRARSASPCCCQTAKVGRQGGRAPKDASSPRGMPRQRDIL